MMKDTITAIATPPGRGGIGIIRVSGSSAESISKSILKTLPESKIAHIGCFYDDDEVIDQGIALFFKNPHSFTGEDTLELHAHGGPVVLDRLLQAVVKNGARLAEPGEFSKRAFLNGKIDLAQAESIADLIDASSQQAAKSAIRSLQGEFSKRIHELVEQITELRKYVEASIDFTEEDLDLLGDGKVSEKLNAILNQLARVQVSARQGVLLREGMTVVIAGKPNVGKSTLLNALSGRDSAIVTDIPGTTRDVLREYIQLDGMPLHIIDTAGLRDSEDVIEQEGVRRAREEMEKADCVLFMVDSDDEMPESGTIIRNKIDLTNELPRVSSRNLLSPSSSSRNLLSPSSSSRNLRSKYPGSRELNQTIIYISAKQQFGIELLKNHLKEIMGFNATSESAFIARRRHLEALDKAHQFLVTAQDDFKSIELLAENLHLAQNALSEITGAFTSDDLLGLIFSSFCVGK